MKRLYYFLFLLVCIACSDAIIEQHVYTQDSQMDVLTRSGGDRKYDLLGFGYDITLITQLLTLTSTIALNKIMSKSIRQSKMKLMLTTQLLSIK